MQKVPLLLRVLSHLETYQKHSHSLEAIDLFLALDSALN